MALEIITVPTTVGIEMVGVSPINPPKANPPK
jgi:hypothetical protein